MELALEPLSPELVLVSPPDAADRARATLPAVQLWAPAPIPIARTSERLPFLTFCAVCLTTTLAPLALIVVVH
jgi:hypothetical protein